MSYTNPHGFPQGNPLETKNQLANLIREMKIGELVAIKDYTMHIKEANHIEVKKELHHICNEEIKHFNKLNDIVLRLDADFKESADELATEYNYKYHKALEMLEDKEFTVHSDVIDNSHIVMCNILADIKGEEEAIISYETSLETIETSDKDGKFKEFIDIIKEIIQDEKEHILELTQLYSELTLGLVKEDEMEIKTETSTIKTLTEDKMAILSEHIKHLSKWLMDNYKDDYHDMSITMFVDKEDKGRVMVSKVGIDMIV